MTEIFEERPDENEQYENLDESLDEQDLPGHAGGGEGRRELDLDIVADQTELEEAGANLDDPEQMSLLEGGMDDPDGTGPPEGRAPEDAGWDVDPVAQAVGGTLDDGVQDTEGAELEGDSDPRLDVELTDPTEFDELPEQ